MNLYAGLDLETTGLEIGDHRIIEAYVGLWRENGDLAFSYDQRIDPQRAIAIDAQRVHGISIQDLAGKPTWDAVAPKLLKVFEKATHYVAHNGIGFDIPFLTYEFKRVGLELPNRPIIDTMTQGIWSTPDGKMPNLGELCFACGVDYDSASAHAASYDVSVTMECFFRAKKWGFIEA